MVEAVVVELLDLPSPAVGTERPTTYRGYEAIVRLYLVPGIGQVPLHELSPLGLQHLYSGLLDPGRARPLSAGTVLNAHLVLTQALSQAVRWGLIGSNPAGGAQPPRPRRPEPVAVGTELASQILAAVRGTRLELPVAIAIGTGMRRGEILALCWSDVDEEAMVLRVRRALQTTGQALSFAEPKTRRSRRQVALPRFLLPHLARQRDDQRARAAFCGAHWAGPDLVVDRGDGYPVNPDTLSSAWRGLIARSGLPPVRFNDLRHAHATLLLAQEVHPKVVSERLGHASVGSRWTPTPTCCPPCSQRPPGRWTSCLRSRLRPQGSFVPVLAWRRARALLRRGAD